MKKKNNTLAALGGEPVCRAEWPSWPVWDKKDEEEVLAALKSGGWGICPEPNAISRLSRRFAEEHHAKYAICCCNGTVGLMIALRAAGVLPGDEVIMPAYTFMATATAAIGIGATPVIVDVEPGTLNLDPSKIEPAMTERTRAVLPVHIGGMPAAMDRIMTLAEEKGLAVVEDSAQAHFAEYDGRRVGAIGHAGAFSFQSSKNLTAGEGGIVVTDDPDLFRMASAYYNCGRDPDGRGWYEHPFMGQNLRMSQLQAALLHSQMDRLAEQHRLRVKNARYLAEKLSNIDGVRVVGWPWPEKVTSASYHLFNFMIDPECFGGVTSQPVYEALRAEGVPCHGGYGTSLQDFDFFEDEFVRRMLGKNRPDYKAVDTPVSRHAVKHCIWLKQNQLLADQKDMDQIAAAMEKVKENAEALPRLADK